MYPISLPPNIHTYMHTKGRSKCIKKVDPLCIMEQCMVFILSYNLSVILCKQKRSTTVTLPQFLMVPKKKKAKLLKGCFDLPLIYFPFYSYSFHTGFFLQEIEKKVTLLYDSFLYHFLKLSIITS